MERVLKETYEWQEVKSCPSCGANCSTDGFCTFCGQQKFFKTTKSRTIMVKTKDESTTRNYDLPTVELEKCSCIQPEKVISPEKVVNDENYNDNIISITGLIGTFISCILFLASLATLQPILITISIIMGAISLVCAILFDNSNKTYKSNIETK